jgi:hypothetical protein
LAGRLQHTAALPGNHKGAGASLQAQTDVGLAIAAGSTTTATATGQPLIGSLAIRLLNGTIDLAVILQPAKDRNCAESTLLTLALAANGRKQPIVKD